MDSENSNVAGLVDLLRGEALRVRHVDGKLYIYGPDLAALLALTDPQAAAEVRVKAADKWALVPNSLWNTGWGDLLDIKS